MDVPIIEACVDGIESAKAALSGGVNSLELCSCRSTGGVTPSIGMLAALVESGEIPTDATIHVLIRPREGNFVYSSAEMDVILRDIVAAKNAGANGVVVGMLNENGDICEEQLLKARLAAEDMFLTFHRAFDVCRDPLEALEAVIRCGCDRLLTSGHSASAASADGVQLLQRLMELADGRILIVAAAGVNSENVGDLIAATRVNGVHAGTALATNRRVSVREEEEKCRDQSRGVATIGLQETEDLESWFEVDEGKVRIFVETAVATYNS